MTDDSLSPEIDRESGEEAYAAREEEAREASPFGLTLVKTDHI